MAGFFVLVIQHPASFDHDTGATHPERVQRLGAVKAAIEEIALSVVTPGSLGWDDESRVLEAIHRTHEPSLSERLKTACATGRRYLDTPDCAISAQTYAAAIGASASALAACEAVARGDALRAFCANRPPGHHAERKAAMGFCFFNHVAVGADFLIAHGLAQRVAIVDFDVHHGNGTQHLFERRSDVLYISTHQHPGSLYPGTGYGWERGVSGSPGHGTTLNIPLNPGSGHSEAVAAYEQIVVGALEGFEPDFVLVSAGFDADRRDPLAQLNWNPSTYRAITELLAGVADRFTGGRLVTILEGGYDESALKEGLVEHLRVLTAQSTRT